jgi:hypothetical protein
MPRRKEHDPCHDLVSSCEHVHAFEDPSTDEGADWRTEFAVGIAMVLEWLVVVVAQSGMKRASFFFLPLRKCWEGKCLAPGSMPSQT